MKALWLIYIVEHFKGQQMIIFLLFCSENQKRSSFSGKENVGIGSLLRREMRIKQSSASCPFPGSRLRYTARSTHCRMTGGGGFPLKAQNPRRIFCPDVIYCPSLEEKHLEQHFRSPTGTNERSVQQRQEYIHKKRFYTTVRVFRPKPGCSKQL